MTTSRHSKIVSFFSDIMRYWHYTQTYSHDIPTYWLCAIAKFSEPINPNIWTVRGVVSKVVYLSILMHPTVNKFFLSSNLERPRERLRETWRANLKRTERERSWDLLWSCQHRDIRFNILNRCHVANFPANNNLVFSSTWL